jgi:hypothetical protein
MTIYQSCGFFNVRRNCFSDTTFQAFIEGLNVGIAITRYRKAASNSRSLLIKIIGQESYPAKPLQQVRQEVQPPNHRLKIEETQLLAHLLKLCREEVDTTPLMPSDADTASLRPSSTMTNGTNTMCQKFNIRTPDKAALGNLSER